MTLIAIFKLTATAVLFTLTVLENLRLGIEAGV